MFSNPAAIRRRPQRLRGRHLLSTALRTTNPSNNRTTSSDSPLTDLHFAIFSTTDQTRDPCLTGSPFRYAFVTTAVASFSGIWCRSEKSVRIPETRRAQQSVVTWAEVLLKIVGFMKWDIFTRFSAWNAEARDGVGRRLSICLFTKKASGQSEPYVRNDRCWNSTFHRIS